MMRIAFFIFALSLLATATASAQAIKYYPGKNGNRITCTWQDCTAHCQKNGGNVPQCSRACNKLVNDRKASGECK